jgi:hypothetical protein
MNDPNWLGDKNIQSSKQASLFCCQQEIVQVETSTEVCTNMPWDNLNTSSFYEFVVF